MVTCSNMLMFLNDVTEYVVSSLEIFNRYSHAHACSFHEEGRTCKRGILLQRAGNLLQFVCKLGIISMQF